MSGIWNVDQLAEDLPYVMLSEWAAYFRAKDKKRTKQDHYSAQLAYIIAQSKSKKRLRIEDFYIRFSPKGKDLKSMSQDEAKKFWINFAKQVGGKIELKDS
jgi:hypothetical protein